MSNQQFQQIALFHRCRGIGFVRCTLGRVLDILLDPLIGGPERQFIQIHFAEVDLTAFFHILQQLELCRSRARLMLEAFDFRIV